MSFQASCPACAAPIQFDISTSLVTICPSCNTVAGRGDGKLENYGKVADLVQTDSPLKVGIEGKYKGVGFRITGRAQLKHSAGGVWDEWYVAFRGGKRWGWLAEAQGKLYLTFEKNLPERNDVPSFDELDVEDEVTIPGLGVMKVVEIGDATTISAEGEIPYVLHPGETVDFADLAGSGKRFATLDGSSTPPVLYAGGEVTFEKLGIADKVKSREKEERRVTALKVSCPSCAGPLELRAPDETMRVACPFCGALHEADKGNLKFLKALGASKIKPIIPLGTVGKIDAKLIGEKWSEPLEVTVIGFLERTVTYEDLDYTWHEYLLYRPRLPFFWLIYNSGHWSFGRPVSAGEVTGLGNSARYEGQKYKIYDRSKPRVTHVLGEFYWQVSVGETVRAADFIRPPKMISQETTKTTDENGKRRREINYTLSTYMPVKEVEKAFGVTDLRRPNTVAPNQPYLHKKIYKTALLLWMVSCVVAMVAFAGGSRKQVFSKKYALQPTVKKAETFFSEPIDLVGRKNIQINASAAIDNSWVFVAGYLVNEETQMVYPLTMSMEYYHGRSGGESWTEGSKDYTAYVSAVPEGKYTLRFEVQWDKMRTKHSSFKVNIKQGVPRVTHLFLLLLMLSFIPICIAIHHYLFDVRRWKESDFSPYSTE